MECTALLLPLPSLSAIRPPQPPTRFQLRPLPGPSLFSTHHRHQPLTPTPFPHEAPVSIAYHRRSCAVSAQKVEDQNAADSSEHAILLNVGGMACERCASSVEKILKSQPHVTDASIHLATGTAKVDVSPAQWTNSQEIGAALARHLSSCGFTSSVKGTSARN